MKNYKNFSFSKQDFEYFIGYKDPEKNRPLCIFRPEMIIYKRNFDKNRHIYFLIKEEKVFIKYMKTLEKVSKIIENKSNSELIYSKKYIKAEKKKKKAHRRRFSMFISTNNIDLFNL